ncbi:hypothetical protein GCM10011344_05840 [Dokdonia pacifica]|uniref:Uncharacterized protein n=1 Tax=Dokdonia pacifica TaxID=1627892 RepID=A0A238ZR52_9FLAO|nr:hypothetical protein [Dokdonia pacifica]GGG08104.1 hypothetical protein GCM10011344_05840 [Dokdonia pacifica]SNR85845.1 hypothetical protein SAMN06265376_103452 [Dokdonia pacifica]
MRQLIFIILTLIFSKTYCQEIEYAEIKNIESHTEHPISLDTLDIAHWNLFTERKKIKARNYIAKKKSRIKNDTSQVVQILYYGLADKIKIISKDSSQIIEAKTPSKTYSYQRSFCYPVKTKTYELISFDRNTGMKEFTIYFEKSKRFAVLNIDTNFPEVYIIPYTDIQLIEFEEDSFGAELDENGFPMPAKKRLVKQEDEIMIDYRYPRK